MEKNKFGGYSICKRYGKKVVLDGAGFALDRSGIVGIFGLNGSGKTTLLRLLSGLDGDFEGWLYKTDFEDVAYMSVENEFPMEMRVKDCVEFASRFTAGVDTQKIYDALAKANISSRSFVRSLSSGMRQYFKFLLTVHSGASVCLFDEPTSNLDVNLREEIAQTLIREMDENRIFIITTHEIKEIERLIEGFFILKDGKLSAYYDSEQVVEETGKSIVEFYKEKVNEK